MKKEFDKEIFKEMILYISERCKDKANFGSIHLNKILHYSDLLWYGHTGESISGETYLREKHGQVSKHLVEVRDELIREGFLEIVERPYFDYIQKRPVVKREVEFVKLSKEQREFIDTIIAELVDLTATYISEKIAHEDLSWQYLNNGEEIPYESVFFRRKNSLTEEDIAWANQEIEEYEASMREKDDGIQGS
jgi:hypothetical protein